MYLLTAREKLVTAQSVVLVGYGINKWGIGFVAIDSVLFQSLQTLSMAHPSLVAKDNRILFSRGQVAIAWNSPLDLCLVRRIIMPRAIIPPL
jgi:hypothetical protein